MDRKDPFERQLFAAYGNGSGLAVKADDVPKIIEWKRKAAAKERPQVPLWNPSPPRERAEEVVS